MPPALPDRTTFVAVQLPFQLTEEPKTMNYLRVSGLTAVLFLGVIAGAYGQKEGEGKQEAQPHAAPAQQHAAQPKQAQPAKAPARQAQQAKAPAQQAQPRAQQEKGSALAPQQQHPAASKQQPARTPPQVQHHSVASQQHPTRSPQQAQSWQQKRGWATQKGSWQPHTSFQQGRDQNWAADHRSWAERGGYGGSYIPQASFGLYFGSTHFFHIGAMPVMYMGYPRFAYSGFSFLLVDPWPGSWQENWYASDDVYIDFNNGYYLHDRRYPGVNLAVTVAL
jgi:hypothetical protein